VRLFWATAASAANRPQMWSDCHCSIDDHSTSYTNLDDVSNEEKVWQSREDGVASEAQKMDVGDSGRYRKAARDLTDWTEC